MRYFLKSLWQRLLCLVLGHTWRYTEKLNQWHQPVRTCVRPGCLKTQALSLQGSKACPLPDQGWQDC